MSLTKVQCNIKGEKEERGQYSEKQDENWIGIDDGGIIDIMLKIKSGLEYKL